MPNTKTHKADAERAARLRQETVEELIRNGDLVTPEIADAMRLVPREVFAPGVPLEVVYKPYDPVITQTDEHGNHVSSVSAPQAQAAMLEQAGIRPGHRVLEVGSGGYNAALIAEIVGATGEVTTVDIDPYVVGRARAFLPAAGYSNVAVLQADAEAGVPEGAPYDRIVVTAGAWDVPSPWIEELVDGGILVVPLRMRGLTRTVALERVGDHLESRSLRQFGFVPIRGAGEHPGTVWELRGGEVSLAFGDDVDSDPARLEGVFAGDRTDLWTGVRIGRTERLDTVQMWLATTLPGLCWVTVDKDRDTGVIALAPNRSMVLGAVDGENLAYLTTRATDDPNEVEYGVHTYGPEARRFADDIASHLQVWAAELRGGPGPRISVHPAGTADHDLPVGEVIDKAHSRITISWSTAANSGTGQASLHHPTE